MQRSRCCGVGRVRSLQDGLGEERARLPSCAKIQSRGQLVAPRQLGVGEGRLRIRSIAIIPQFALNAPTDPFEGKSIGVAEESAPVLRWTRGVRRVLLAPDRTLRRDVAN